MEQVYWLVRNRWELLDDSRAIIAAMRSPMYPLNVVRVRGTTWLLDLDLMNLQREVPVEHPDWTDNRRDIMIVCSPEWDRVRPDTSRVVYYLRISPILIRLNPEDTMALDTARASGHYYVRLRLRSPGMLCVISFRDPVQRVLHLQVHEPETAELIMVRCDRRAPAPPRPSP